MTPPTGTALLAQASAEDLERDANVLLEILAEFAIHSVVVPSERNAIHRAAALARAVAKVERDAVVELADVVTRDDCGAWTIALDENHRWATNEASFPAALAALLGGSANG